MTARLPMRFSRRYSSSLLVCLSCVFLISCGKKTATAHASGPQLKWEYKSANSALSHPAVASDGTIYVGTNRGLQAVSPEGKLLWSTTMDSASVPVLADDGNIYLDSWHGLAFGISHDGKIVWQPGYGLIGFSAPPALGPSRTLYYLNNTADIYAFAAGRKDALWSLETFREGFIKPTVLPGSVNRSNLPSKAAPAVAPDGTIFLPRQNFLHAISASGDIEWTNELTSGDLGQLALSDDGTIYVGDDSGVLYAVDSSGATKWRFDAGVLGSPVIDAQGLIYFTDGNAVFALNPDRSVKWRAAQPRLRFLTSPVLASDGTLYLGAEFALIAINPDGSFKWNLRVYTPTSTATIAADGTILFACGYSWLCAVQDSGSPLMQSAWPKAFHDLANTSNSRAATN
jgi:outer membrane protein assembly factor BamB